MIQQWKDFLISEYASFQTETDIVFSDNSAPGCSTVHPLPQFALLQVSGKDAAKFLQGQITCNINEVDVNNSRLGAFCNVKGRVLTTCMVVNMDATYMLIMPRELVSMISQHLQRYILRADVALTPVDEYCLIGLAATPSLCDDLKLPDSAFAVEVQAGYMLAKWPGHDARYVLLAKVDAAIAYWTHLTRVCSVQAAGTLEWDYLDIMSGLPWLGLETTETFIPQMLNLDKLGGISFNKGCYTGQEIVARTHYLGQTKRVLFLAEMHSPQAPAPGSRVLNQDNMAAGVVIKAYCRQGGCRMLLVLYAAETEATTLQLEYCQQDMGVIHLLTL